MPNQPVLNLKENLPSVEQYTFEPIKGYPMLHWKGKRPFTSTQYYPAQLKEVHGNDTNGWLNKVFWGDNLQVMAHLLKEFRGQVDLVYIDPPFDSKADYKKQIQLKGKRLTNEYNSFEEKQYTDIWANDDYLQFIYERLIILRELLSETGSIYVHLNHAKVHQVRCLLDEIFGGSNFKNDIIWKNAPAKAHPEYFGRIKDTVLYYTKSSDYTWNKQFRELSESYKSSFKKEDERGFYVTQPLHSGHPAKEVPFWKGVKPPEGRGWAYKIETLDKFEEEGRIEWSEEGVPRLKRYLSEIKGAPIQDVWTDILNIASFDIIQGFFEFLDNNENVDIWDDISPILSRATDFLGYPTQKPEALLERIIRASSNPGDLIFDCFMGSGTTQAVAMKLGRRFIGADINLGAIQTTTKRLIGVAKEIDAKEKEKAGQLGLKTPEEGEEQIDTYYTGFEVYNVNHYDASATRWRPETS